MAVVTLVALLKNLVGDDFTTDVTNAVPELLETALRDAIDIIPDELLLKYTSKSGVNGFVTGITTAGDTPDAMNKKILKVTRNTRTCKEISEAQATQASDSASMFVATNYSPNWYIDHAAVGNPKIVILPTPTDTESARVDFIMYPHGGTDYDDSAYDVLFNFLGLPQEAINLVLYKAAVNILDARISNAIQDDEDNEMLSMLGAQKQAFGDILKFEVSKLTKVTE